MARLRFPGRPGHRFERISQGYFTDDIKNVADPSLAFLPQFKRGLKALRDVVGASDEEDEFDGFTLDEIKKNEKKLRYLQEEENKILMPRPHVSPTSPVLQKGTRLSSARHSLDSLPASERTRARLKTVVTKSYRDWIKEGLATPTKSHKVVQLKDTVSPDGTEIVATPARRVKPLKFKLDYKHGIHKETLKQGVKVKKTEKDMAKFLLEKAKQANLIMQKKKERRLLNKITPKRKEFVLPTQSSRSSRVIKPNKRFLEEEEQVAIIKKKLKPTDQSPCSPTSVKGRSLSFDTQSYFPSLGDTSLPSFDQPLIVDGKRARKPSLKVRVTDFEDDFDDDFVNSPSKSCVPGSMTSPLAAPKFGTSLFSSQKQFQKTSDKFGVIGFGSGRKQGASIVQKAKLQLNRAALNKSKAALAKSLKKEMKREANIYAEQTKHQLTSPTATVDTFISPTLLDDKKKRKQCEICGQKRDIQRYYKSQYLVCSACMFFNLKIRQKAKKEHFTLECIKKGNCKITPENRTKCRYCRVNRLVSLRFPQWEVLAPLIQDATSEVVDIEGFTPDRGKLTSPTYAKSVYPGITSPPVFVSASTTTTSTPATDRQSATVQELSPHKAGEGSEKRLKKRRAFKELLRTKQEKPEDDESLTTEPCRSGPPAQVPVEVMVPVPGSVEISPGSHGPRIKHVCRNAAVVLGKAPARFPEKSELRLSALPNKDKVQLWKKDEADKAAAETSDDDRSMDEIIQKSSDSGVIIMKKSPSKPKPGKKLTGPGGLSLYKRKMRCKKCSGCLAPDCGKCRHCLDKPKFGGSGKLKQGCVDKRCENPVVRRSATAAFIDVRQSGSGTDSNTDSVQNSPEKSVQNVHHTTRRITRPILPNLGIEPIVPGSQTVIQSVIGLQSQTGTLLDQSQVLQQTQSVTQSSSHISQTGSRDHPQLQGTSQLGQRSQSLSKTQGSQVRRLEFDEGADFQLERISTGNRTGKINSKAMTKLAIQQKYTKKQGDTDSQCYPVTLQSVIPASRQWGAALSQPKQHRIKVDYMGACDIDSAWSNGFSLTMSVAMSVRTLCFLCGSAGKHELIYCNICCEPYHEFCLEEFEQPVPGHYEDWCCSRCQFCYVCGRHNNLLQCDKCQNTYHPECLGPNYPTKPSKKKKIWICTKCVKCKSCGATTPGTASNATWTYDFSMCYECGQLMDKGNFCPICRKCYSDDDWESKMIQCNTCVSWVHSRCEGLTDEMYEILSYLPEDLSFYCRKCYPVGCPEWESTLKRELRLGLENILQTLILSKSAAFILKSEKKSPAKLSIKCKEDQVTPEKKSNQPESHSHLTKPIIKLDLGDNSNSDNNCKDSDNLEVSVEVNEKKEERTDVLTSAAKDTENCDIIMETENNPKETKVQNSDVNKDLVTGEIETKSKDDVDVKHEHVDVNDEVKCSESEAVDKTDNSVTCDNVDVFTSPTNVYDNDVHEQDKLHDDKIVKCDSKTVSSTVEVQVKEGDISVKSECRELPNSEMDVLNSSTCEQKQILNEETSTSGSCLNTSCDKEVSKCTDRSKETINTDTSVRKDNFDEVTTGCDISESNCGDLDKLKHTNCDRTDTVSDKSSNENARTSDVQNSVSEIKSEDLEKCNEIRGNDNSDNCTDQKNGLLNLENIKTSNNIDLVQDSELKPHTETSTIKISDDTKEIDSEHCEMEVDKDENVKEENISMTEQASSSLPVDNNDSSKISHDTNVSNKVGEDRIEVSKDVENKSIQDEMTVTRKSHKVHFVVEDKKDEKPDTSLAVKVSCELAENDNPKDLMEIAYKMKTSYYKSVANFCEDILRIIQDYLDDDGEVRSSRKKAIHSARSIFVKQVEKVFPWYNIKLCRYWYSNKNMPIGMLPTATLPPGTDHTYAQWLERTALPISPQPSPFKKRNATPVKKYMPIDDEEGDVHTFLEGEDIRKCAFCLKYGDQNGNAAGRLLYIGQDGWCHINCALWSAEVYEDADGSLQNLVEAYSRGAFLKCDVCGRSGATVGCNTRGCKANYHFMCAREDLCSFQEDKKVFCHDHRSHIDGELLHKDRFSVLRRVYVNTLVMRRLHKNVWNKGLNASDINVLIGSCCVENLGRLTDLSDKPKYLQPVDFMSSRIYWSTKDARRRCVYTFRVVEVRPQTLLSPAINFTDKTIIHDEHHPDYIPISQLDLSGINLVIPKQQPLELALDSTANMTAISDIDNTQSECVDLTADTIDLSETMSAEETREMSVVDSSKNQTQESISQQSFENETAVTKPRRSNSFSGMPSHQTASNESKSLSVSWPRPSNKQAEPDITAKKVNLSFLSPKTLKMLNIKDPSKYVSAAQTDIKTENNDEFGLLKIANRLNSAAAKCSQKKTEDTISPLPTGRSSRSPSVERFSASRPFSPIGSAGRPFSPVGRMQRKSRSHSSDQSPSPVTIRPFSPVNNISNDRSFSPVLANLPDQPFSPPVRMLSRARSLSVDKEIQISKRPILTINSKAEDMEKVLPKFHIKKMVSILSSEPQPVSSSSPVQSRAKPETATGNVDNPITLDADLTDNEDLTVDKYETQSLGAQGDSCDDIEELNLHLSDSDDAQETIVVMTDSGESLTEEEAIRIVQEVMEQKSLSLEEGAEQSDINPEASIEFCSPNEVDNTDLALDITDITNVLNKVVTDIEKEQNLEKNSQQNEVEILQNKIENSENVHDDTEESNVEKDANQSKDTVNEDDNSKNIFETADGIANSVNEVNDSDHECVETLEERSDSPFIPKMVSNYGSKLEEDSTRSCKSHKTLNTLDKQLFEVEGIDSEVDSQDKPENNLSEKLQLNSNAETREQLSDECVGNNLNTEFSTKNNEITAISSPEKYKNVQTELNDSPLKGGIINETDESDTEMLDITESVNKGSEMKDLSSTDEELMKNNMDQCEEKEITNKEEINTFIDVQSVNKLEDQNQENVVNIEGSDQESKVNEDEIILIDDTTDSDSEMLNYLSKTSEENIGANTKLEVIKADMFPSLKTNSNAMELSVVGLDNELQSDSKLNKDEIDGDQNKVIIFSQELETDKDSTISDDSEPTVSEQLNEDDNENKASENMPDDEKPRSENDSAIKTSDSSIKIDKNICTVVESDDVNILIEKEPKDKAEVIDNDSKIESETAKEMCNAKQTQEVRSESEKQEVLRGLGLGTSDEVEKIKNSPTKTPPPVQVFSPVLEHKPEKPRRSSSSNNSSPVKTYPLRRNTSSPARYRHEVNVMRSPESRKDNINDKDKMEKNDKLTKSSDSLPVYDPLSKKIKEESIAKSCASDKGPFKCPTCRRMYRTEASYTIHLDNCNFVVSSSEDEDVDNESNREISGSNKAVKTRSRRLSSKGCELKCSVVLESIDDIKSKRKKTDIDSELESGDDNTDNDNDEIKPRASLRRNTIIQRLALEVEEKRMKEENVSTKKSRGRPSLKGVETDNEETESKIAVTDGETVNLDNSFKKRGRGRPRKHSGECVEIMDVEENDESFKTKLSERSLRRTNQELEQSKSQSECSDSENESASQKSEELSLKRGRGRPRKESIEVNKSLSELKRNSFEQPICLDINDESQKSEHLSLKRGRGRPRKESIESSAILIELKCNSLLEPSRSDLTNELEKLTKANELEKLAKAVEQKRSMSKKIKVNFEINKDKTVNKKSEVCDMKQSNKKHSLLGKRKRELQISVKKIDDDIDCELLSPDTKHRTRCTRLSSQESTTEHNKSDCLIDMNGDIDDTAIKSPSESSKRKRSNPNWLKGKSKNSDEKPLENESCVSKINNSKDFDGDVIEIQDSDEEVENLSPSPGKQSESSADNSGPILDYTSGLIIDHKTGFIMSPSGKNRTGEFGANGQKNDTKAKIDDKNISEENESIEVNDNEDCIVVSGKNTEKDSEKVDEGSKDNDEKMEVVESEKQLTSPIEAVENQMGPAVIQGDSIDNLGGKQNGNVEQVKNTSLDNKDIDASQDISMNNNDTDTPEYTATKVSLDNLKGEKHEINDISKGENKVSSNNEGSLPSTVLKLLKDGHKVVIKNPKLNKNFIWEKTATGYVGKPFEPKNAQVTYPNIRNKLNTDPAIKKFSEPSDKTVSNVNSTESKSSGICRTITGFHPKSASEILAERKKQATKNQNVQIVGPTNSNIDTVSENINNASAKLIAESINKLITDNRKAVQPPQPVTKCVNIAPAPNVQAQYVGGIFISPPKEQTVSQVQQKIQSTAVMATQFLQNSFLSQNQIVGQVANINQTFVSPNLNQFSPPIGQPALPVQNVVNNINLPIPQQQAVLPIMPQTNLQTFTNSVQTGYPSLTPTVMANYQSTCSPMISQTGLTTQTSIMGNYQQTGFQNISPTGLHSVTQTAQTDYQNVVNQPLPGQQMISVVQNTLNQSGQVTYNFVPQMAGMRMMNVPVQTQVTNYNVAQTQSTPTYMNSSNYSQSMISSNLNQNSFSLNQSTNTPDLNKNSNCYPGLRIALQSKIENKKIIMKPRPSVTIMPKPGETTYKHPVTGKDVTASVASVDKFEKMRKYLLNKHYFNKHQPPTAITVVHKGDRKVAISTDTIHNKDHTYKYNIKAKKKAIVKMTNPSVKYIPVKGKTGSPRKRGAGRPPKYNKYKLKKKTKKTPKNNTGIAMPHSIHASSHPIIHPQKEVTSLPVAAMEEEVMDVPLSAHDDRDTGAPGTTGSNKNLGHLEYEITSDDGFSCRADTVDGAWKQVTEKVQDARTASRLKQMSYAGLSGMELFGLTNSSVVYLVEQLYGANYCRRYKFKYHKHQLAEQELELLNPSGSIRTEPFSGRNTWDMFSFLMSRYRNMPQPMDKVNNEEMAQKSSRRHTSMGLPMAMRFRKLKEHSREAVGVYRSTIHGRGLFCKRNIDGGEMIIEYAGEVIRNSMTDLREKYYESKGIGCYMFRIDDCDVVDATMRGSAARFINHSCEPNCYSKVINVDNRKHIVIFAMTPIVRGEELTYDYKFPIEEVKILCTCGSRKCRKYLN